MLTKVILFCPMLEFKNKPGLLMGISPQGYYEVRVDLSEALRPIQGDPLQLRQIFTNLVGRAFRRPAEDAGEDERKRVVYSDVRMPDDEVVFTGVMIDIDAIG